ncbi:uncharacterized protein P174DRAFT_3454 [Aspergillus novofumigatus IBT 16806]|uniref:Uncharacterized protein n=1 Tax=Aspergillus novofumigatus (strain IBT 16806) TaxID=1392255 RepID=A0A2I1CKE4_ASPN1|nr:uncharacterized protein P174DRAFT_3454 [Aspergillus novofumigatus IBT 16806]PKX98081.1 hypothetical protein P174DRAFT_3454 [Aspergillus novofumigatus IBT 16806]
MAPVVLIDLVEWYSADVIEIGMLLLDTIFALIVPRRYFCWLTRPFLDFARRHKEQAEEQRPHGANLCQCIGFAAR